MIGLGSNRLSVCRRGGMSVTQAGRGGMEWLAGGRRPRWSSPYSAQATAALKAQFPTQWPTIRDYGFAHPEIVGYMNAYAPEDAKIAYSLVEGIGTRTINGNGSAYMDLLRAFTGSYMRIEFNFTEITFSQSWGVFFGRIRTSTAGAISLHANSSGILYGNIGRSNNINMNKNKSLITNKDTVFTLDNGAYNLSADGESVVSGTYTGDIGDTYEHFGLWCYYEQGSATWKTNQKAKYIRIYETASTCAFNLIPFIRKINNVEHYGMIDLLTGTFYGDATGNNGFTISETPAS